MFFFFFFIFFIFFSPVQLGNYTTIRIPMVPKGLNNQRMRIIQDITISVLLDAPVELPTNVYSRRNCHYKMSCAKDYVKGPSIWDVYDQKLTLVALKRAGVSVIDPSLNDEEETNTTAIAQSSWPVAASHLGNLSSSYNTVCQNASICYLGPKRNCCTLLIPNTERAAKLLKNVNYAFKSAEKYKKEASQIIAAFRKETNQDLTVAMHWRLDDDFVLAREHSLSPNVYCKVVLNVFNLALINRFFPKASSIHILLLGDLGVDQVEDILRSCGAMKTSYKFCSKETLLLKNESVILTDEYTDVKGQLDFELGTMANVFIGSPFSSFSVLIAFTRFGSPSHLPIRTIMANVDVRDHLARLFSVQFPYSHSLTAVKSKCSIVSESVPGFRNSLKPCVMSEKGMVKNPSTLHRHSPILVQEAAVVAKKHPSNPKKHIAKYQKNYKEQTTTTI